MKPSPLKWIASILVITGIIFVIRTALTEAPDGIDDEVHAVVIQSTGKSVIAGKFSDGRIQRRNLDGSVDATFKSNWVTGGFNLPILALAIQPDDKIVAGGQFTSFDTSIAGHILRLNSDGSLDTQFAAAMGTGFDGNVSAITLQTDRKLLVVGDFSSFNGTKIEKFARLNEDGTLDTTFNPQRSFDGRPFTVTIQSNNQIFVGGAFSEYVLNFFSTGQLNSTYYRGAQRE